MLCQHGRVRLTLARGHGGVYRALAGQAQIVESVVAACDCVEGVHVMPGDGGWLATMPFAAQLALALRHGVPDRIEEADDTQQRLAMALRVCQVDEAQLRSWMTQPAQRMPRMLRWRMGLVLRLVRPAELLVLERAFAGLSRQQAQTVLDLVEAYQQIYPFRPLLLLDLDTHDLPSPPQLREVAELAAVPTADSMPCLC